MSPEPRTSSSTRVDGVDRTYFTGAVAQACCSRRGQMICFRRMLRNKVGEGRSQERTKIFLDKWHIAMQLFIALMINAST